MDWNAAIDKNREALKRVLAMLVAMAEVGLGGQSFRREGADASGLTLAETSKLSPALTLPRHLYRYLLGLLRPAEAAARRLIIVAARGLVVPPPHPRQPAIPRNAGPPKSRIPGIPPLPLLDPLTPWSVRARPVPGRGVPRISVPGYSEPFTIRLSSADDPIDATRLALRLKALGAALDDLPRHAKRFARWRARLARRPSSPPPCGEGLGMGVRHRRASHRLVHAIPRSRRLWPLRPGRPPGWRRKPVHEVHEVLDVLHGLAHWVLEAPDTS